MKIIAIFSKIQVKFWEFSTKKSAIRRQPTTTYT